MPKLIKNQPTGRVVKVGEPIAFPGKLGPNLVDTLNTAAAWQPQGANTVAQAGDEVEISYVDSAVGARGFFRSLFGLYVDLTVGKTYVVTGFFRVFTGAPVLSTVPAPIEGPLAMTQTTKTPFKFTFVATGAVNNYLYMYSMAAGFKVWLSSLQVREVINP